AQDTKSLNPLLANDIAAGDLSMFIFSYAIRYDDQARPVPDAVSEIPTVENGDVSADGLTLKYKLRPNILWHDGEKLTCKDLDFTWRVVMNPANNGVTTDGYKDIASIDCSDPLVAVVHMKRVYAPFLQQLWGVNGNAPILPAHLLEKLNDKKGSLNTAAYNSKPIGSGPFYVDRWDRGSQVVLKAFDRYFTGKPRLDEVVFKIVPDDTTMINQVRTHEVDMALHVGANMWPQLRDIPGTIADPVHVYTYQHIDFNLKKPMFQDIALRRALAMAVDRHAIINKIAFGLGDPTDTALSPKISWGWTNDTAHYDYDLAKARTLLDADGWKIGGRDGVRVKNGERLAFNFATQTESNTNRAIEALVQREWHDVGADVSIKNAPSAQFFDNTTAGVLQGGKYDVATFGWGGAADPDDSAIYSGHNMAPKGQNALFWDDAVATKAMDDELLTVDRGRRKKDFVTEQQRFASEVPSIVLYYRLEPEIYNVDLKGYKASPVISPFWDPQDYSI
ncbi:MAG TPA: peptide ABC transporter substrate-binding protein, partial [Candidatus Baltobacteraceae bacterium]|nr:peptide ABC transporter substrate-binding protein [Candidatus Baltobacteraceae bacterium]